MPPRQLALAAGAIILKVGVKTFKKAILQANTHIGVLFQAYNFFEKYSVYETFQEVLKTFQKNLWEYLWMNTSEYKLLSAWVVQNPVKNLR